MRDALGAKLMLADNGSIFDPCDLPMPLTRIEIQLESPGLRRNLTALELSDGTIRFLCLAAALLTTRPAPFLALNEPETSLHPDLIPVLAGMIVDASRKTQICVTTHYPLLAERILEATGWQPVELSTTGGETRIVDDLGPEGDE